MDAVKFLKEYERMCKSYGYDCGKCGIDKMRNGDGCTSIIHAHPEEAVSIVEKWSDKHPAKTRQSKFLNVFPDVEICDGTIHICPEIIDKAYKCKGTANCNDCRKDYWLVEEAE